MANLYTELARLASQALSSELELYPKPGLVSLLDNGSHRDMTAQAFRQSILVLDEYWLQAAQLGAAGAPFAELRRAGLLAEKSMLEATAQKNTHRGAIFIVGILLAAVSYVKSHNLGYKSIARSIRHLWGAELRNHQPLNTSHGSVVRRKYQVKTSIIVQAVNGFEQIFQVYQPLLAKLQALDDQRAQLQLLFILLANIEDTNLLYRGGLDGLSFAQNQARNFLAAGGIFHPNYLASATQIHHEFVSRNLSPGGSADLLAATIFIDSCKALLWA